jgi:cobyrinic acid a,c-diamide synthase
VNPDPAGIPLPRLVIGAPQGRSGKTTVALGLCTALTARGLCVQPFKKGPDYIDPSWLSEAAGRACRTLDPFFFGAQPGPQDATPGDDGWNGTVSRLREAFGRGAQGAGISLIEGNHGLYDGQPAAETDDDQANGSTAALARVLWAPILLVVNTARMGRSIAALVHGYQTFEPGTPIAGVILNNVANARHEARLRAAVEGSCGIPVLGALPRNEAVAIPDRHLGLVPRDEDECLVQKIGACRAAAQQYLDLDAILALARAAPRFPVPAGATTGGRRAGNHPEEKGRVRIGVFRDRAFTFYYPENLEALADAGAQLVPINAFEAPGLPALDGLYIGGGFPEMFMEELAVNRPLLLAVRAAARDGLPIYAECGGLMYLSRRIVWGERSAEMAGVLPCEVEMTLRPQGHGYVSAEVLGDNPFFAPGSHLRGHEFHNSRLVNLERDALTTAYRLARGSGLGSGRDGLVYRNVLAAYTHLHAAGAPTWATGLVERARTG